MRHLTLAIIAAALGLATTVLIAWTLAVLVDAQKGLATYAERVRPSAAGEGRGCLVLTRHVGPGSDRYESFTGAYFSPRDPQAPKPEEIARGWARRAALPWTLESVQWPGPTSHGERVVEGRGWPMRAFWCELTPDYGTQPLEYDPRGGFTLPAYLEFIVPKDRGEPALPCRPIVSGLLINSALFAAAWWGLLFAPALVRRFLRRKRGRCPKCGYDLLGNLHAGCPECGWRRMPAAPAIAMHDEAPGKTGAP